MRAGCEQHAQVNRQFLQTNVESLKEFDRVSEPTGEYEVDEPAGHTPKKRKRVSEEDNDANSNEHDPPKKRKRDGGVSEEENDADSNKNHPEHVVLAKTRSHQELLAEFRWVLLC